MVRKDEIDYYFKELITISLNSIINVIFLIIRLKHQKMKVYKQRKIIFKFLFHP